MKKEYWFQIVSLLIALVGVYFTYKTYRESKKIDKDIETT